MTLTNTTVCVCVGGGGRGAKPVLNINKDFLVKEDLV